MDATVDCCGVGRDLRLSGSAYEQPGGGSILTAGQKLASESLDMLTPDEWKILFESGPTVAQHLGYDLAGITLPMLSDEDAQAIVDSLANNGVATFADAQNLQGVQIPPELQSLIDSITG